MKKVVIFSFLFILFLYGAFFLFWEIVMGGSLHVVAGRSVTVTGTSKTRVASQVASFHAGVMVADDNKETAENEVNTKMAALIAAVKEFGIDEGDIQTSNISVFQEEEPMTVDGRQRSRPGQWRVSNDINVTLRAIEKASALTMLLSSNGATNVFGPNFIADDSKDADEVLLNDALEDAQRKADILAKAGGRRRGRVLSIIEGNAQMVSPLFARDAGLGGGGGVPVEPGSQTVSRSITVTFELR